MKSIEKAMVLALFLALALISSAMIHTSLAQPWYNESNYAYFVGEVTLWSAEWVEEPYSGQVVIGPNNSRLGGEPDVMANFDVGGGSKSFPDAASIMSILGRFSCRVNSISMVRFNYGGKDFYMSGTWAISRSLFINTGNISKLEPFIAGLNITDVAIVSDKQNITYVTDFLAAKLGTANVKVFNITSKDTFGYSRNDYTLRINDVKVGKFTMVINYAYFPESDPTIVDVILEVSTSYVPGELYVTGNWTEFGGYIEGLDMFSGKIDSSKVQYTPDKLTAPMTDVDKNHVIDISDISKVARIFESTIGSPKYDPDCDFNADGIIDIVDLTIVAINFGATY
jgi:hypothetical protein